MAVALGVLERIEAKTVWQHEALEFTPWLRANIDQLAAALGIDVELAESEIAVGDFACDILAKEVITGRPMIVENQLAQTDHSHLGQLLTYAAGLEASVVVWLSPAFRPEHRQALDWLNAHTPEDLSFFGVELELLRIGGSPAAPHFKLVAQPNDWQKSVKAKAEAQPTGKGLEYQSFWKELLALYKTKYPLDKAPNKATTDSWLTFGIGRTGFTRTVAFLSGNKICVELGIATSNQETNKAAFDELLKDKDQVETQAGASFSWERLETAKSSRVRLYRDGSVSDVGESRAGHLDWAVSSLGLIRDVFAGRVKALVIQAPLEAAAL